MFVSVLESAELRERQLLKYIAKTKLMAVAQDPQLLDVEILPVLDETLVNCDNDPNVEDERCFSKDQSPTQDHCENETQNEQLVLEVNVNRDPEDFISKVKNQRCCFWSSKAAFFVLILNLIISCCFSSFLEPSTYMAMFSLPHVHDIDAFLFTPVYQITYSFSTFLLLFYPLAGCLADVRCGRHTTIVNSLCFLFSSLILVMLLACLATIGFIPFMVGFYYENTPLQIATVIVLSIVFGLPVLFGVVLTLSSLVAFNANVIQYGLDQLDGNHKDDAKLYIHWYVWTIFVGSLFVRIPLAIDSSSVWISMELIPVRIFYYPLAILIAIILLGVLLFVLKQKRALFQISPASRNPFKLVYKILKYSVRKCCSKLDLCKQEYGGPFESEEVDNVKAFLGIIRIIFAIGPIFAADVAFSGILPKLAQHELVIHSYSDNNETLNETYTYFAEIDVPGLSVHKSGCITPLMVVIFIPLYLKLIKPFLQGYVPRPLKRIGMGMILLVLSGLCTLVMGLFERSKISGSSELHLFYMPFWEAKQQYWISRSYLTVSPHFLAIQSTLNAIGYMLLYIASFEFICIESPESMKGLLIGTFFAIKGVFQFFGAMVILDPIIGYCHSQEKFPVCGFIYYLINIILALAGIILFTVVAKRYKYRQRDVPQYHRGEYLLNDEGEPDENDTDSVDINS